MAKKQCTIPVNDVKKQISDIDEQIEALKHQKQHILDESHTLEIDIVGSASGRSHGEDLMNERFDVTLDDKKVDDIPDIDFFNVYMDKMLDFFKSFKDKAEFVVLSYQLEDVEGGYNEDVETWNGTLTMPFDEFIEYFSKLDDLRDLD